ncbi:hypothetical protein EDD16DRAFT_92843 [Pisolithus croceorrhizus]|nr:hypothetical protein EDD16DRAFT_92843 [Pisolithus croceorrhizus]
MGCEYAGMSTGIGWMPAAPVPDDVPATVADVAPLSVPTAVAVPCVCVVGGRRDGVLTYKCPSSVGKEYPGCVMPVPVPTPTIAAEPRFGVFGVMPAAVETMNSSCLLSRSLSLSRSSNCCSMPDRIVARSLPTFRAARRRCSTRASALRPRDVDFREDRRFVKCCWRNMFVEESCLRDLDLDVGVDWEGRDGVGVVIASNAPDGGAVTLVFSPFPLCVLGPLGCGSQGRRGNGDTGLERLHEEQGT